jgi:glycerol-3-phosphate dehydrogenase
MELMDASTRASHIERMSNQEFDVLVIGGGITGAGVALDAAARGYRVALIEKGDFASATSSKSTKLVHGGIRYLPQFDFALVREALVERGLLVQNAPFLVEPLAFLLPLYEDARRPLGVPIAPPKGYGLGLLLQSGLWMYDIMAGRLNVARHRRVGIEKALNMAPSLHRQGLKDVYMYYDAQTNDTRLTITVLKTAVRHGALIANYAELTSFTRKPDGKIGGAVVRDHLSDRTLTVRARHVVNAAGIFAQRVMEMSGDQSKVRVTPSKGVHLLVARERLNLLDTAVVLPETDDGRILFVVPWGPRAVIGTTDTGEGDLDHPEATPEDIAYLIRHVNRYLDVNLSSDDILSAYAGYRPLVSSNTSGTTKSLSRTHVVVQEENGIVTIVGGKLTTYRRMAQDTVDVLQKRDNMPVARATRRLPLAGAVAWKEAEPEIERQGHELKLSERTLKELKFNYGREALEVLRLARENPDLAGLLVPDLPYIRAEIIFACRHEMALTLTDVLARRTRITLEDRDRGTTIAPAVAAIMAAELGWSEDRVRGEVENYRQAIREEIVEEGLAASDRGGEASMHAHSV